jgi:hypothetical protein
LQRLRQDHSGKNDTEESGKPGSLPQLPLACACCPHQFSCLRSHSSSQSGPDTGNWERQRTLPEIRFIALIIEFLGFDPLPQSKSFPEEFRDRIDLLNI